MDLHTYNSLNSAYDATQTGDVAVGDVIHVPSKSSLVLAWTWPLTIAGANEVCHTPEDTDAALRSVFSDSGSLTIAHVHNAITQARTLGLEVLPWVDRFLALYPMPESAE